MNNLPPPNFEVYPTGKVFIFLFASVFSYVLLFPPKNTGNAAVKNPAAAVQLYSQSGMRDDPWYEMQTVEEEAVKSEIVAEPADDLTRCPLQISSIESLVPVRYQHLEEAQVITFRSNNGITYTVSDWRTNGFIDSHGQGIDAVVVSEEPRPYKRAHIEQETLAGLTKKFSDTLDKVPPQSRGFGIYEFPTQ